MLISLLIFIVSSFLYIIAFSFVVQTLLISRLEIYVMFEIPIAVYMDSEHKQGNRRGFIKR